jgi:hypothetical protein
VVLPYHPLYEQQIKRGLVTAVYVVGHGLPAAVVQQQQHAQFVSLA